MNDYDDRELMFLLSEKAKDIVSTVMRTLEDNKGTIIDATFMMNMLSKIAPMATGHESYSHD